MDIRKLQATDKTNFNHKYISTQSSTHAWMMLSRIRIIGRHTSRTLSNGRSFPGFAEKDSDADKDFGWVDTTVQQWKTNATMIAAIALFTALLLRPPERDWGYREPIILQLTVDVKLSFNQDTRFLVLSEVRLLTLVENCRYDVISWWEVCCIASCELIINLSVVIVMRNCRVGCIILETPQGTYLLIVLECIPTLTNFFAKVLCGVGRPVYICKPQYIYIYYGSRIKCPKHRRENRFGYGWNHHFHLGFVFILGHFILLP